MTRFPVLRRWPAGVLLGALLVLHGGGEAKDVSRETRENRTGQELIAKLSARARADRVQAMSKATAPAARRVLPQFLLLGKLREAARAKVRSNKQTVPQRSGAEERTALLEKLAGLAHRKEAEALSKPRGIPLRPAAKLAGVLQEDEDAAGVVALSLEMEMTGLLEPVGDIDDYTFSGEAGQAVSISLTSEDFDAYLELEFDGELIAVDDDGGEERNSLLEDFVLPLSGEYVVRVHSYGDVESGSYSLSLAEAVSPFVDRGELGSGSIEGVLEAGESHFYTLSFESASHIQIDLISEEFDPFLALYEGDGVEDRLEENLLAEDDDGGVDLNSLLEGVIDPGSYLLEVRSFSSEAEGAYTLSLAETQLAGDEDEDAPVAIAYGEEASGGLFPEGDTDDYTFAGEEGELIVVSLTSEDFDTYLELEFDGELIDVDDDGGEGRNSLLEDFVLPLSGEYVVRVRSYGDGGEGSYSISLERGVSPFVFVGEIEAGGYEGELEAESIHLYAFEVEGFAQVRIDLVSEDFDAFLVLYEGGLVADRRAENRLAADDDGGEGLNSQLFIDLGAGIYLIEVRSFSSEAEGDYALDLQIHLLEADEDESGPVAIDFGDGLEGGIFPMGDVDDYSFFGEAGEVVSIGLTSEDFDAFLELELDGELIVVDDDGGEGLNSLLGDFVLPLSGEYLVRVHVLGDAGTGEYFLEFDNTTPPLALQEEIGAGTFQGELTEDGQLHLFPLTLTALSEVRIDLVSEDFDAFLVLYAGDGAEDRSPEHTIAVDDDGGSGLNSRMEELLPAGAYLIEARSLSSTATGEYDLNVEITAIEGDEDDPTPAPVVYGQELDGRLLPAGDIDAYALAGQAGDVIDISLTSEDFDTFLELEFDGKVIAADDDGGEDLNSLLEDFVLPVGGEFIVRVHSYADEGTGSYALSVENNTPPLALKDVLNPGKIAAAIGSLGDIHLYPFSLETRSQVQIDLTASEFDGFLALFAGSGSADRRSTNLITQAEAGGESSVRIAQELPAGAYLLEVRPSAAEETGSYGLELGVESVRRQARDQLAFESGRINGTDINPFDPVVAVNAGEKISGTLNIGVSNSHPASQVFPVGATPSWGDRQSSFWAITAWAPPGDTTYQVTVDLVAPAAAGTYYILLAGGPQPAVANIMSGTHWEAGTQEQWDDEDDVAAWGTEQIASAVRNGRVGVDWAGDYSADIGATAVRVVVVEAPLVPAGPISLDFDSSEGNQGQLRLETAGAGQTVEAQLHVAGAPEINGWSIRIEYDPEQVRFSSGSFQASDFLAGLVSLVDEKEGRVDLGGAILGSSATNSGDGFLGTVSFDLLEGFVFSTDLAITQVTFRTVDQGRIKENVRSVATLNAGQEQPSGPLTMDFDLAEGDQQERRAEGGEPGKVFEVQLNVVGAPSMSGWSARIEFDASQVRYVSGSFQPSGFIPGLISLVGEKLGRVDVGGTVLGGDTVSEGAGVLGTASFEVVEGFADSAEVVITQISFNTVESGEVIQRVHSAVIISAEAAQPSLPGDFSGDGAVDFSDFFLFADQFGRSANDPDWDPLYDLSGNGEVDFSDFFLFADAFGREGQGKLLALAREYIGLPVAAHLEQNYPNPFNNSTTIHYHVLEPGLVRLDLFDVSGQRVRSLVDEFQRGGRYRILWDGTDERGNLASSGVFFCQLEAGEYREVRKMLFVK